MKLKHFESISLILLAAWVPLIPRIGADDYIHRRYQWSYGSASYGWDLNIPLALYQAYKDVSDNDRLKMPLGAFVTVDDPYVKSMASAIRSYSIKGGFTLFDELSLVLAFVQSLPYTSDSVSSGYDEYPRFPLETLADNGGDCEDTSILYATLIKILGYDSILIRLSKGTMGHVAVGVAAQGLPGIYVHYEGRNYYYAETTGEGWKIGMYPRDFESWQLTLIPYVAAPYDPNKRPNFYVEASYPEKAIIGEQNKMTVKVANVGGCEAKLDAIEVSFGWTQEAVFNWKTPIELQPNEDTVTTIEFKIPENVSPGLYEFKITVFYHEKLAEGVWSDIREWKTPTPGKITVESGKPFTIVIPGTIIIEGTTMGTVHLSTSENNLAFYSVMGCLIIIFITIAVVAGLERTRKPKHPMPKPDVKYCIMCGAELPTDAVWCHECRALQR